MRKFELVLLIHAHQPVGNFEDVIERAYQNCYLPFVDLLSRHPSIRLGLHYSGPLLEWIERAHPEYLHRLRELVASRQIEIIGGGFYEPILVTIPPEDRQDQIVRLADYVEKHVGARPRGAWIAERVWEPQIPSSLAPASVEYTLVDDNHFLGAGFEVDQLYGYYLCEDLGHTVKVLPGLKILRYLIPFHDVKETTDFCATQPPRIPVASRPWVTISKNSAFGPARTIFATKTAGSTASSPPSKKFQIGWPPPLPVTRSPPASLSAAPISPPLPTRK